VGNTKEFTHISLCAGYGGIDLGLSRVITNLRTICFCEIEEYPIRNLIAKMEKNILPPTPIWTNLKTLPFGKFFGKVDFISGGFPCQPFSAVGKKNGDTDPRHLFPFIKNGINQSRPAFVFLENVRGIISSNLQSDEWNDPKGTPVLLHVCRELERIGYEVEWGLFSAGETGLPQKRQRVFILGKRNDITFDQLNKFRKFFSQSELSEPNGIIALEKYGDNTRAISNIRSNAIAIPNGRNTEQFEFEPRRSLNRENVGNTYKIGLSRHLPNNSNQSEINGGRERSQIELSNTFNSLEQSTPNTEQNIYRIERIEQNTTESEQSSDQSTMDRDANGSTDWLDYDRLSNSYTDIKEEVMLLGNGVVPATAEIAFRILYDNLCIRNNKPKLTNKFKLKNR
jgi:DNA-cytosine methyltransferase